MRLVIALVSLAGLSAAVHTIAPTAVENATFGDVSGGDPNPALAKAQTLLDRARFSPGAIDGKAGDNTKLAVKALQ
jgi:peptidoglycan hydrolase-like protein with peptidoglycan-binding domain